jgi:hypothetical protein
MMGERLTDFFGWFCAVFWTLALLFAAFLFFGA